MNVINENNTIYNIFKTYLNTLIKTIKTITIIKIKHIYFFI